MLFYRWGMVVLLVVGVVALRDMHVVSWLDETRPEEVQACKYTCEAKSSEMKIKKEKGPFPPKD